MSLPDSSNEEDLFVEALARPETERPAFLTQACGGNAGLRASVEALLRAHQAATSFLPSAVGDDRAGAAVTAFAEEKPGDWIGRYRILQRLGEGGCGIVYMSEQEEPVRRRVALKVIKLGMDTKEVIARFEAERQALAMMDHPNIAKVLDAGATHSGRPFFVMELVRGIPVTKYCDENGLPTEKRLELFSQICHAIQHAHQKGIIHRDIKPSNILVTLHDGLPVPKVIDFGIAKATQGRLTDRTLFTAYEQFIGTPAYMSPEQAEMSGLDVDTRSDIYSLGVLLYELLTGRPPFDPKTFVSAGLDEVRRLIREVDPPKPSARLSTLTAADQTTVAKLRSTAPAQLSIVLAGDLDWIVMRCLEKDRTRRYATPSELVADIQRYLRNEPVIARPPSTGYLLRKLIRRHKLGFAAGTAVAISLIVGLVMCSVMVVRERAARQRAVLAEATQSRLRREAEQAGAREAALRAEADANASQARAAAARSAQVAKVMTDMLDGVGPSAPLNRDSKVLPETIDTTARQLDTQLRDQPGAAADLCDTLGAAYIALGRYDVAERLLRAAVATHRTVSGNQSAETAASLNFLGQALRWLNKPVEAEAALQEALAIRRKLLGPEHPLVAETLSQLAWVQNPRRKVVDRRAMLEEVLAIRRKAYGNDHPDVANAISDLGMLAQGDIDHSRAALLLAEALAMRRRLYGNDHPAVLTSLDNLGYSYGQELDRKGDAATTYGEALALRRKTLGDAHPATVASLVKFAGQLSARNVSSEDLARVREFVANERKLLPPGSPLLGPVLLALAPLEDIPDRNPDEAQALVREGRQILDQAHANGTPLSPEVTTSMFLFAWFKFFDNLPAEGLPMGEEVLALTRAPSGAIVPPTLFPAHTLAWIYLGLGRDDEAAKLLKSVVPICLVVLPEEFPMTYVDMAALGASYCATNRVAESHHYLATALASFEAKSGAASVNPHIVFVHAQFGLTLLREGHFAEAETMLRRAIAEYDNPELKAMPLRLQPRQRVLSGLGQALAGQGKFAEAEPLVVEAFQQLQTNERRLAGNSSGMVREAFDAVIALYAAWGKPEKVAEWKTKLSEPLAASR